ncbi:MAG: hypothetical protein ABFS24_00045 [Pseudomonadota bacterium]
MRLLFDQVSLVLLGGWNPAILQPKWIAKEIFNTPEGEDVPATITFPLNISGPPKVEMKGVAFVPTNDNLAIFPTQPDEDGFNRAEQFAINLLRELPHTPISAFGENFVYVEDDPNDELLRIFNVNDDIDTRVEHATGMAKLSIKKSMQIGECLLNITRSFDDGVVKFSFNFHYEVNSAEVAGRALGDTFFRNYTVCQNVMQSYNADLEELGEANHG